MEELITAHLQLTVTNLKSTLLPTLKLNPPTASKSKLLNNGGLEFEKELTININDVEESNIIQATTGKDKLQGTSEKDKIDGNSPPLFNKERGVRRTG